ncbi:DUF2235 domain-containing protein [Sulfitobacter sp. D35]|uniref:DUF2235 domain-containing protein n=1 Tax=Sulfitobacter sp. D35 TaxID=3083252 RepID=UPI00296E9917|nr:DUF2235 domain-containing protein [Sulfitobacter sp. D35]MDW4497219.1 DUF2235 domain-containing protein [Sulfitobacter sp. D35]
MPKNIVILMDGTSNEIRKNRSNILRLYGTLKKSQDQIVFYDPGVGTFGADNAWSRLWRKTVELWGLATGWGMDENVKESYRFIVEHFDREAEEKDRIYIIGFSRGAYTARVLAGFLHAFGLVDKTNLNLLDYAYRAYKRIGDHGDAHAFDEIRLFNAVLRPYRPEIRFLGLFDTVSSVIESGRFGPRLTSHAFTKHNPSVQSVRQAVSIAERRTMFRPQLWPEDQPFRSNPYDEDTEVPQDAREVWFSGVHGDVGGGYAEEESGLAKLPLDWLIDESRHTELQFVDQTVDRVVMGEHGATQYAPPDPLADKHVSLKGFWWISEYVPRRPQALSRRKPFLGLILPRGEPRWLPEGARLHWSVLKRVRELGDKPVNLPERYEIEGSESDTENGTKADAPAKTA